MKKIFLLSFIGLVVVSCNNPVQEIAKNTTNIVTATEAEYSIIDTTNHYEIDLIYPVIDGDFSNEVLNNINNTIAEKFNTYLNKNDFIEAHQDLPDDMPSNNGEWSGRLSNTYGITQCDSIITIWFSVYQYYLGAAHGFTLNNSLHFSLNTGMIIKTEDIFKTDQKSIQILKSIINSNLPDSLCWGIESDSILLGLIDNFIFSNDSITMKVDDYLLCPYAFGLSTISYAKKDFDSVLKLPELSNCIEISVAQAEGAIATH